MERRRRTAPRLAGLLVCAAVPALLVSGCSSGSGSGSDSAGTSPSGSAGSSGASGTTSPTVAPGKYRTLPSACAALTKSTVSALVPKAKSTGGSAAKSSAAQSRGGCSWTGNGSDGYQYRWLSVTLQRFDSDPQLGTGDDQAKKRYSDQVSTLGAVKGFTEAPAAGVGDQATSVAGQATVAHILSQNDTVVARTGNVVVIVEYNGAGLEGKKNPGASTVNSGALRAVKEAVAAVAAANA
ncbi:DUF3558 domain-containing protein [Actinacidiphila acidipaludis]|uniref:DUF3558 domain-containing protein n=1 Tax=Actinacidiphila acidipaludis TaxID=2873382 RepID=A0ABS7Q4W3_9ACTN|nr:DUF3558 domain-containing protein [Streptomyces acidipaludis]MBY8878196.1 DUF3558 domain-containing protein [Streptomyces acidipaludis]